MEIIINCEITIDPSVKYVKEPNGILSISHFANLFLKFLFHFPVPEMVFKYFSYNEKINKMSLNFQEISPLERKFQ